MVTMTSAYSGASRCLHKTCPSLPVDSVNSKFLLNEMMVDAARSALRPVQKLEADRHCGPRPRSVKSISIAGETENRLIVGNADRLNPAIAGNDKSDGIDGRISHQANLLTYLIEAALFTLGIGCVNSPSVSRSRAPEA